MDRRSFLKLAGASPALVSPVHFERSRTHTGGTKSETVIGSQSLAPPTGFAFNSPLAEAWYRAGEYFEWTSTTRNNEGRRVQVFYRTFGRRSNPALVILHGYPTSSFDFQAMIPFLEEDYFVAVLDFPGFGFSDKPQDGYSYMLEDDAQLVDFFVREIVGLSRFHLLTHDRGGSVGFAFLGNYLAREEKNYEITYHFISNGGLFLPLANLSRGQYEIQDAIRGPELIREQQARPRLTAGTAQQVAYADIQAFNDGIGAASLRRKVSARAGGERVPLAGQPSREPDPDRAHLGASGHSEPATDRQSHLVQLPRQEAGGEQLLDPADRRPLPATGRARRDGRHRSHVPGGRDPSARERERVYADPGSEQDR